MTTVEAIADTGFVIAVALATENWHEACVKLFRQYERIYLPQTTLAELAFMITRTGGQTSGSLLLSAAITISIYTASAYSGRFRACCRHP